MAINSPISIPASLFYPKDGFGLVSTDMKTPIMLDLIISESHSFESEVSTQPIQFGSDLSIHIKKKLMSGSLVGLISNWGLNVDSFIGDYAASVFAKTDQRENRAKTTWRKLKTVWEQQIPMTVVCALEVYKNVLITGLKADRNGESGEAQEIEIKFQRLNVVKLQREQTKVLVTPHMKLATTKPHRKATTSEKKSANSAKQAAPKASLGKVTTIPAEPVGTVGPGLPPPEGSFEALPLALRPGTLVKTVDPYIDREVLGNFLKMHNPG